MNPVIQKVNYLFRNPYFTLIAPFASRQIYRYNILRPYCKIQENALETKKYDIFKYKFSYSEDEKKKIISYLNTTDENGLTRCKLGKGLIKKYFAYKSKEGEFEDVSDLLDIDGFGIQRIEKLYSKILDQNATEDQEANVDETIIFRKRLVKPKLTKEKIKYISTITALTVTISHFAWTTVDIEGKVVDIGCDTLMSQEVRLDAPKLYEKVVSVSKRLPVSDMYIWEEKGSHGHLHGATIGTISLALQLAQIRGILIALLNTREGNSFDPANGTQLFYMRDALVSKLFRLQVGNERIAWLSLADKLMNGEEMLDWLEPPELCENIQKNYFEFPIAERRQVSSALFVALAAYHVLIHKNKQALKILMK